MLSPWKIIQPATKNMSNTNQFNKHSTSNFNPAKGTVPTLINSINDTKPKIMIEDNIDVCNKNEIKHIHDIPKSPIVKFL
jgi:hypothetical protein